MKPKHDYVLDLSEEARSDLKGSKTVISPSTLWKTPPKDLDLGQDEVHVWRTSLDIQEDRAQSLQSVLSEDEKVRADRFYFQESRTHFIAARGTLRMILGRYIKTKPEQLRFTYNAQGKPGLAEEIRTGTCFNISHSHGTALLAFTRNRKIGVDLECIRSNTSSESIAPRFFTSREAEGLNSLPANLRKDAFFTCWTRKEAYLKARGEGFSFGLNKFEVTVTPGGPASLLWVENAPEGPDRWTLKDLDAGPKFAAALAVERNDWRLKTWQWEW